LFTQEANALWFSTFRSNDLFTLLYFQDFLFCLSTADWIFSIKKALDFFFT